MDLIEQLTESLRCLPGVGPKTAQRLVYYFLKNNRKQALHLAKNLDEAMRNIVQCDVCNNYCARKICRICSDAHRDSKVLCIVENASDVSAIEQSHIYKGYYFILTAKISPIDGVGTDEIGLDKLKHYLASKPVEEVIIALTPSIETQATLCCIQRIMTPYPNIKLSQLAQGVPTGSELQTLDPVTIGTAIRHRSKIEN